MSEVRRNRSLKEVMRDVYKLGIDIPNFNIKEAEDLLSELKDVLFEDMASAKTRKDDLVYARLAEDYGLVLKCKKLYPKLKY